jgi:hypothetical protein
LNPRPLAPRLSAWGHQRPRFTARIRALWYPVGGIVFPDQAVQRVVATSLF